MPDRTHGYHLFLEPEGEVQKKLQALISNLAQEYGGPVFSPHVTVLAEVDGTEEDVLGKCEVLAKGSEPFELSLGEAGMEDTYFRALYLRVQESTPLWALHQRAAAVFSKDDAEPYMPHASLLYGMYPEERKRAALAALPVPSGASFMAERLSLWHTEGAPSQWRRIAVLPFGAN